MDMIKIMRHKAVLRRIFGVAHIIHINAIASMQTLQAILTKKLS